MRTGDWKPSGTLGRYFGDDRVEPVEHWPPDRLRAYQRDAVAEQLAHVAAHNDFYQAKFSAAERLRGFRVRKPNPGISMIAMLKRSSNVAISPS
ncbi:MAG: hypothetical protein HC767_11540 [Akkermansiaceae bacterium]|nr:hypothetical protein [Akkermansiaceae bacterium]